jgi:hypothetical protein
MIEVFKTNLPDKKAALQICTLILQKYPLCKANVDLDDCDKILRIEGDKIPTAAILHLLQKKGYQGQVLE